MSENTENTQSIKLDNLAIWSVKKRAGRLLVTEYIDLSTGEIICSTSIKVRSIRPDSMNERFKRLNSLRDEVLKFALFVLYFRNEACGFLVPFSTIKSWYGIYSGKRSNNINRLTQKLIDGGILENEIQLTKIFMLNNPNRTPKDALADVFIAESRFSILMLKSKISSEIQPNYPL